MEKPDFITYYEAYFERVNRYLRVRVSRTWDADDLTTIVFTKAYEHYAEYNPRSSFGSWIFRIAHNTYIDFLRRQREQVADDQFFNIRADDTWQPEKRAIGREEMAYLRDCFQCLPDDQRDVLILRFFGELKIAQIAEVLGKSESAVKMISHRGIRRLRELYQASEGGNKNHEG